MSSRRPSFRLFFRSLGALWTVMAMAVAVAQADPTLKGLRLQFQNQELTTAKPNTRVFTPGEAPAIIWRDVDEVRRLGGAGKPTVRWFDVDLKEVSVPDHPGRWAAWVEDVAPNHTPVQRCLAFFARPKDFLAYFSSGLRVEPLPGPVNAGVWREHQAEIDALTARSLIAFNDTEAGAILLAGLTEATPQNRPPTALETAAARNEAFQFAVKMKVLGLQSKVRALQAPRPLDPPAPEVREGTAKEAGAKPQAKAHLDAVLDAWAADTGEPFVTLVARHGVIITHQAAGCDSTGKPIGLDYKANVASITKTTTAILFSQFLDQGLLKLDDRLDTVFPNYPKNDPHGPTFRQCLTHMSGFSGHGDWGGARNPNLDNVLLNGLDANKPGEVYAYAGMGFDACALAMQLIAGQSFTPLYHEHLFKPLSMGTAAIDDASAGATYTALDLAKLAQWLANRGSYGNQQFITPATFATLLPEDLRNRYPGVTKEVEGIGMHWMHDLKPGARPGSTLPEHIILSERTLGHGSLSSCVLRVDLDRDLIVVQIRRQAGPRYGEWLPKFLQTVADEVDYVPPPAPQLVCPRQVLKPKLKASPGS